MTKGLFSFHPTQQTKQVISKKQLNPFGFDKINTVLNTCKHDYVLQTVYNLEGPDYKVCKKCKHKIIVPRNKIINGLL